MSLKFENLWYDMEKWSHISPCLLHNSFNLEWTSVPLCSLMPRQKYTILLSHCLSFLSFLSGLDATSVRTSLRVGKTSGASLATFSASACNGYNLSILLDFESSVSIVSVTNHLITCDGITWKHALV